MEGRKRIRVLVLTAFLGVFLVLMSTQVASLQEKPREPKRLEAKIIIEMGEKGSVMFYANPEGVSGVPFRVPAGKTVGIKLVNISVGEEHEVMFGRTLMKTKDGKPHGYEVNLFEKVPADMFVYPSGNKVEIETEGGLEEIELEPDGEVWIRTTFPEQLKGEWEIGCFIEEPDKKTHYDLGMKAKLIIE